MWSALSCIGCSEEGGGVMVGTCVLVAMVLMGHTPAQLASQTPPSLLTSVCATEGIESLFVCNMKFNFALLLVCLRYMCTCYYTPFLTLCVGGSLCQPTSLVLNLVLWYMFG